MKILLIISLIAINLFNVNGFLTYFNTAECPENWEPYVTARGRLIISVVDTNSAGVTVGKPLQDREEPTHQHQYSTKIVLPEKDIAAIDCCNDQGAGNGVFENSGNVTVDSSYLPFTQLLLCRLKNTTGLQVPFGTIAYFDPASQEKCPLNWVPFTESAGRSIVPAYKEGGLITSSAKPFTSGEVRMHKHSYNISFSTESVEYIGAEGCCNHHPAKNGEIVVAGDSSEESINVPYVQLLTCQSTKPTFNVSSLPSGALIFNAISCPKPLTLNFDFAGRLLVVLPDNGLPAASFGGNSFNPNGTSDPAHSHVLTSSVDFPSTGVGLGSGCCGKGYAKAGTYKFTGDTQSIASDFPYLLAPLCQVY